MPIKFVKYRQLPGVPGCRWRIVIGHLVIAWFSLVACSIPLPNQSVPPQVLTLHASTTSTPGHTPSPDGLGGGGPLETLEGQTPTPGATLTSSIQEITPGGILEVGGIEHSWERGLFTPYSRMRVRRCPFLVADCDQNIWLDAGYTVVYMDRMVLWPSGDMWLCLEGNERATPGYNQPCASFIAYQIGGKYYGHISDNSQRRAGQ